jgi:FAD/FMN-containing dehydrogenase
MPNGEVWNGLKRLRKGQHRLRPEAASDRREGTLGVVTAAALKLFPVMVSRAVAISAWRRRRDAL